MNLQLSRCFHKIYLAVSLHQTSSVGWSVLLFFLKGGRLMRFPEEDCTFLASTQLNVQVWQKQ
jgi:hypothetical protein